jgi:hypothetical protein
MHACTHHPAYATLAPMLAPPVPIRGCHLAAFRRSCPEVCGSMCLTERKAAYAAGLAMAVAMLMHAR